MTREGIKRVLLFIDDNGDFDLTGWGYYIRDFNIAERNKGVNDNYINYKRSIKIIR